MLCVLRSYCDKVCFSGKIGNVTFCSRDPSANPEEVFRHLEYSYLPMFETNTGFIIIGNLCNSLPDYFQCLFMFIQIFGVNAVVL